MPDEITFRRSPITADDIQLLDEGNDLNDAVLDFFVKLGSALLTTKHQNLHCVSSLFYQKLTGSNAKTGEEAWENIKRWTLKIPDGVFSYPILAIPINETFLDEKKKPCGQHWWLALILNAQEAGRKRTDEEDGPKSHRDSGSSYVVCVDSMKRRVRSLADEGEPITTYKEGTLTKYALEISKIEQAGHRIWIDFRATGDGSLGVLQDPAVATLTVDGSKLVPVNEKMLRINNNTPGQPVLEYNGMLEFLLDSRSNAGEFVLNYGPGFGAVNLEFDGFVLSKFQKEVCRYTQGMLRKEWERKHEDDKKKKKMFDKQRIRAVAVNAPQQENLNDCGVFVLENVLTILNASTDYPDKMARRPLSSRLQWVGQTEVKWRRRRLKECMNHLFELRERHQTSDVEQMMSKDSELRDRLVQFITDLPPEEPDDASPVDEPVADEPPAKKRKVN